MAKKFKPASISEQRQGNLFAPKVEGLKLPEQEPLAGAPTMAEPVQTPPPQEIKCPQCGGPAAKSTREPGQYYCHGACSYGDNFYFTP